MLPVAPENVAHLVSTDLTATCWNKHTVSASDTVVV